MHREPAAVPPAPAARLASGWSNLADLVAARAAERPDAVALVEPTTPRRALTWAELDTRVNAVATGLASRDLRAGHRLALLGPGSVSWVLAYLATLRAGIVAVPLNPQSAPEDVAAAVAACGARVLLSASDPGLPGVTTLPLTEAGLDALAVQPMLVSSPQDPESLAVLVHTAGSSGRAKAAMLTHRALLAHIDQVSRLEVLRSEDVVLATLPLFHVFGLNAVLGGWLGSGARLVVTDGYPDDVCALVRDEGVTFWAVAPPTLHRLLAEPDLDAGLGRLRTVVSGAAPLPEALAETFSARTGLRVERGYGLTEAAGGVTTTLAGGGSGSGHVGRALPGVEIRVGDGDGTEPAEIAVRGRNLFSGYWPDGRDGPDPDGWFATGDIGYLDGQDLVLVDRSRELVVVQGFQVYPAEIEQAILEVDGVEAVAVVGQAGGGAAEQVVAFVQGGVTAAQIAAHCERRLARFKRPAVVHVLDELPRGAMGKIRKGTLREMSEAEQGPA